jgi:hypothetical protein
LNGAWTRLISQRFGNGHVDLYYFANSAGGSDAVTFSGSKEAFAIGEYAGISAKSPVVDQFAGYARSGSPTAGPTSSIRGAGELVIGVGGMSAPTSFSAGSGFALRTQAVNNYFAAVGLEDAVSTSNAGQSMSMVPAANANTYSGAIVAVFEPSLAPTLRPALTVSPASGAAPLPVTADASGTTDTVAISTYSFNFGDGTAAVGPQAAASATHTYRSGGRYTATVTVTDTAGATATASATVTVVTASIAGVVTDAGSGAAISGVQVSTQPATSTTASSGSGGYQLSVPAGTYNVIFSAGGYNSNFQAVTVSSGATATANQALIPVPALTAEDLFSRPNQGGIGTASDGHAWSDDLASNPSAGVQISNQRLYLQTAGTLYDAWMGYQYQDQEVAADVDMVSGGARLLARVQGNGTWLVLAIDPASDNLVLWAAKNGQWTQLKSWTASPALAQNTWYHAKLRAVGQTVSAKVWAFGTAEPAWQITATQSILTGGGQAGLRSAGATDYVLRFTQIPVTQIAGTVTSNATKQPIAGATVTLSSGATTTTDSNGSYTFAAVGAGSYTVTASASGYNAASQTVTVTTGVGLSVNFAL